MLSTIREMIYEMQENDELFYAVTDYAMDREMENGFEDLCDLEKKAFMIGKFLMELNNGGLDQYFLNTEGKYAVETVNLLDSIGEKSFSRLLDEAIRIGKAVIPDDQKTEELSKLDDRYYYMTSDEYQALYDSFTDYLRSSLNEVVQLEEAGNEGN